jgi:RNA polymerase sigma factor FliA
VSNRDELIASCQPLAYGLAASFARALPEGLYEWDDLIACAQLGLVEAATRYDEEVGGFKAFAYHRIHGAIVDGLRKRSNFSRGVYEFRRRSIDMVRGLEMELGRSPTEIEIAESLGMSNDAYRSQRLHVDALERTSLAKETYDKQDFHNTPSEDADPMEAWEMSEDIADAMRELPERERFVLYCIYWQGMTQQRVSELLGVNHSRISQLKFQGMSRLRGMLANYEEG